MPGPTSKQLSLGPMEVKPLNRSAVKSVNPLKCLREARVTVGLKLAAMASAMGISEPLLSAQLSDHDETKHLSLRRLGRVQDVGLWREFCLQMLEDCGFCVVIVTPDQKAALVDVQAACAAYARVMMR